MQTTVTGPGTLSFYWKVSSEANYDFLEFWVDGVLKSEISGEVNWQQKSFSLASGSHLLSWSYSKDRSVSAGSDAGWLDRVQLTSAGASAHIYIEHTYRGDLVVDIGVGNTASPLWSSRVSNRQGGSADNLDLTVDLSAATAYLPPSNTYQWFLKVYDAAAGDQGRITQFTITYQGITYTSTDVPVSINDLKTSYAYIPSPVSAQAHVYIQHTYRGDLIVDIGVGSTSTPLWSKRVWSGTGGNADNLDLYIDLSSVVKYLPPSATYAWWVKVYDKAAGDTGKIVTFTITYQGKTYTSPNVPVPIYDLKTSYAYIKG
jgi:subtilisin-like proprotein convertase family protein